MSAAASPGSRGLKLGAEPRKLALLGGLIVVVVLVWIYNSNGTSPGPSNAATRATNATASSGASHPREHRRTAQRARDRKTLRMQEVTVEAQQGSIDPTLRLDLLQRLKGVKFAGAGRSLFEPGPAELPPQLAKKVIVMPGAQPGQAAATAAGPAAAPQPPPITLKFYGFAAPATSTGARRGFFLDEDEVLIANEGDTIKGRYHIVSLQPKSAEVEDLTTKNRQSLPIAPEGSGSAM